MRGIIFKGIKREDENNTLPFVYGTAVLLVVFLFHLVRYVFADIWGGIYSELSEQIYMDSESAEQEYDELNTQYKHN